MTLHTSRATADPAEQPRSPRTWLIRALVIVAVLGLTAVAGVVALDPVHHHDDRADLSHAPRLTTQPPSATRFRVSSFNLLGYSHTAPGGDRKGWASGTKRMTWAVQLINANGLDLIGFQEMQRPQFDVFTKRAGSRYALYPGTKLGTAALANSVAWPRAEWRAIQKTTVPVPYFHGRMIAKPLVLLRNRSTGQRVWFFNTHNPANAFGPAQKWRRAAVDIEIKMVNALRANYPGVPVIVTGDMNDREKFYCPMTAATDLLAANGGTNLSGVCRPPSPSRVDWVMGTSDLRFTGYTGLVTPLVRKTTDHALIFADATMPSPAVQKAGVRHVIVLNVEGLPSRALGTTSPTPRIRRMMTEGSATRNARTAVDRTTALPNLISELTGRPTRVAAGGHGVIRNGTTATTVAQAAGTYVSSVFDLVHNFGRSTAFLTSRERDDLVERSWDAVHGGLDPYGADNGRDKISRYARSADDTATVDLLQRMLVGKTRNLTVVSLSSLSRAGHRYGYASPQYRRALHILDTQVGGVLDAVRESPTLASSTVVVLAGGTGGTGTGAADRTRRGNYTVPIVVWGSAVATGANLYAINPAYPDPGTSQPGLGAREQPIRTTDLANLVTGVLGLPAIPGSRSNGRQDLNVLVGATP